MRTYDKLIATICTGQGNGDLRPSLGPVAVCGAGVSLLHRTLPQDTA